MIERLPDSWCWVVDDQLRAALAAELDVELAPDHPLAALPRRILARCVGRDDVLVSLDWPRVAEVHLTWSRRRERDARWPACTIHSSMRDWALARALDTR
ncbi:hypothetical protein [Bradyrhizobium oligotrophicum]|uniref:hypothetical protein n=1 Tax=Bradyrhizobium oligotrophicum TaxID=44255 RepID=UPI003EBA87C4